MARSRSKNRNNYRNRRRFTARHKNWKKYTKNYSKYFKKNTPAYFSRTNVTKSYSRRAEYYGSPKKINPQNQVSKYKNKLYDLKNNLPYIREYVCTKRKQRKEILHARKKVGRGNSKPTFTLLSKIKC